MKPLIHITALCLFCLAFARPALAAEGAGSRPSLNRAPAPAQVSGPPLLTGVRMIGLNNLPQDVVQNALETQAASSVGEAQIRYFEPSMVERDKKRLLQLYQEYGYFRAQVSSKVEKGAGERQVVVVFTITENQPSTIRSLNLEFTQKADREQWEPLLRQGLTLQIGKQFNLLQYKEAKAALGGVLSNRAHPLYVLRGQARSYPEDLAVDVVFQIEPGPRILFGKTTVVGNERVSEEVILRELSYSVGKPFSNRELTKSEQALLDTGFFSSVSLEPQFTGLSGDQTPIRLVVSERPAHSVRVGFGWGTEDLLRFKVLQVNRNLLGLSDNLTIEGKVSNIYQGITGRWSFPYFPSADTHFSASGGREQRENEAYLYRSWFLRPVLESKYSGDWSWFASYNLEQIDVVDVKSQVPNPELEEQGYFISSFPLGLRYDSRDSVLNPTTGQFFQVQTEVSLTELGSELGFLRPTAEYSIVVPWPENKKWAYAARVRGGAVFALGGDERVPLVRRFFPGGADSVRGYPYQRLGPLDDQGNPLGGEVFLESNFELRFPLELADFLKGLGGVVFLDLGNAWGSLSDDIVELRATTGAGLRYNTPVGPLRMDFGYQLNPPEGATYANWQLYLSVGQAF